MIVAVRGAADADGGGAEHGRRGGAERDGAARRHRNHGGDDGADATPRAAAAAGRRRGRHHHAAVAQGAQPVTCRARSPTTESRAVSIRKLPLTSEKSWERFTNSQQQFSLLCR